LPALPWVVNGYVPVLAGFLLLGRRLANLCGDKICHGWTTWTMRTPTSGGSLRRRDPHDEVVFLTIMTFQNWRRSSPRQARPDPPAEQHRQHDQNEQM
jgi:hypothetical protein